MLLLYQQPQKPLGHKTLSFRWSPLNRLVKSVGRSRAQGEKSPLEPQGKMRIKETSLLGLRSSHWILLCYKKNAVSFQDCLQMR